ncbi:MAG: hypothetical protein JWO36_2179 [Myxococcales bacterium]|nr:hypothetical protein [Myxococcales bacterium]
MRGCAISLLIASSLAFAESRVEVSLHALGSGDRAAVAAAVTEIEHAPAAPELADALLAAARACEDKLADPAHALAIYERIVRELPDARAAGAAERRVAQLRAELGPHGEYAREAGELAQLIADADRVSIDEVVRRATALSTAAWPGAPDAALWLAEWHRRSGRFEAARAVYDDVAMKWPRSPRAILARRGAAGAAIDARDWALADRLVRALSVRNSEDVVQRDELVEQIARGRFHDDLYLYAWIALAIALAGLAGSLVEASLRGGRQRPAIRPPVEVMFLAPVACVLIAVAFTAHRAIAPAVLRISIAGIVVAWLSGTTLDLVRARGRSVRARAVAHVLACVIAVAAVGYIAMTRDGLVDLLAETVRGGPDAN